MAIFRKFKQQPLIQGRKQRNGKQRNGWRTVYTVLILCAATALGARAQTFTTLAYLDNSDGGPWLMSLIQGTDGNLYGTTTNGGTVFKITRSGSLAALFRFCGLNQICADGNSPFASLVLATDGNLYGTTAGGGNQNTLCEGVYGSGPIGCGTVFKTTPAGNHITLYRFCSRADCTDGANPSAGLIQANDGIFYGTTYGGGAYGYGTVFKITASGILTTLHSFNGADGEGPGGLIQALDGNFYGTTTSGAVGPGTVFKITPSGTLTVLHNFELSDGAYPQGGRLIQASDANFYGTTNAGGPAG